MRKWFGKRPWMFIVLAFVLLIGIWTWFIILAVNNQPEKIEPEKGEVHDGR